MSNIHILKKYWFVPIVLLSPFILWYGTGTLIVGIFNFNKYIIPVIKAMPSETKRITAYIIFVVIVFLWILANKHRKD